MFSRNANFRLYPIGKKEASYSWRLKLAALHFENILCLKFGVWIKEEDRGDEEMGWEIIAAT